MFSRLESGRNPAKIRPGRLISGPEAPLRTIRYLPLHTSLALYLLVFASLPRLLRLLGPLFVDPTTPKGTVSDRLPTNIDVHGAASEHSIEYCGSSPKHVESGLTSLGLVLWGFVGPCLPAVLYRVLIGF